MPRLPLFVLVVLTAAVTAAPAAGRRPAARHAGLRRARHAEHRRRLRPPARPQRAAHQPELPPGAGPREHRHRARPARWTRRRRRTASRSRPATSSRAGTSATRCGVDGPGTRGLRVAGLVHESLRRADPRQRVRATAGRARPVHRRASSRRPIPALSSRPARSRAPSTCTGGWRRTSPSAATSCSPTTCRARAPARRCRTRTTQVNALPFCNPFAPPQNREMFGCPGVPAQQDSNFVYGTQDALDFFLSTPDDPYPNPSGGDAQVNDHNPLWGLFDRSADRKTAHPGTHDHAWRSSAIRSVRRPSPTCRGSTTACRRSWRSTSSPAGTDSFGGTRGHAGRAGAGGPVGVRLHRAAVLEQPRLVAHPAARAADAGPRPAARAEDRLRRLAGGRVDSMLVVPRASTHLEYTDIPYVLPASRQGQALTSVYVQAWLDRYLKRRSVAPLLGDRVPLSGAGRGGRLAAGLARPLEAAQLLLLLGLVDARRQANRRQHRPGGCGRLLTQRPSGVRQRPASDQVRLRVATRPQAPGRGVRGPCPRPGSPRRPAGRRGSACSRSASGLVAW